MKRFGQKCRWCRNQVNAWLDKFCEGQFLLRPFTQNQISTFLPSSFSKVEHRRWCSATNWQEIVESIDLFLTGVYVGSTGFDLIALFTILVRDVQRHISRRRSVTSVCSLFILESRLKVQSGQNCGQKPGNSQSSAGADMIRGIKQDMSNPNRIPTWQQNSLYV